jgi:hypothetical protein
MRPLRGASPKLRGRSRGGAGTPPRGGPVPRARDAIRASGLSYAAVGRAVGLSGDQVARVARGESRRVSLVQLSTLLATVGLAVSARTYPAGDPIRDRPQLALLGRLRTAIHPESPLQFEAPLVRSGRLDGRSDHRAWDAVVELGGQRVAIEAETRLGDIQATLRRLELKRRDGEVERLVLLLNDTVHNRRVVRAAWATLRTAFPGSARQALTALRAGTQIGADTIVFA